MIRFAACWISYVVFISASLAEQAEQAEQTEQAEQAEQTKPSPPTTYELLINGESFLIEANEMATLQSPKNPGTKYQVALRLALQQRVRLNSLRFEYDRPARVEDDRGRDQRTARIEHELGFQILISDYGDLLEEKARDEALKIVTESVLKEFEASGIKEIRSDKPHQRAFANSSGRGTVVHVLDEKDIAQTCLIYILTGKGFSASTIVQYIDADSKTVLPSIKKTLDSIQPLR